VERAVRLVVTVGRRLLFGVKLAFCPVRQILPRTSTK
jgi:hypothetical protein